ncbi:MAG: hypothetical protein PHD65_05375 [Gallionella sp.]|nr:hypothetical protein [Gallionella sp.]
MALIWRKHLSVGNATLDSGNKKLLGMVNSIEYAISTKDSAALLEVIKSFKGCAEAHFANEARFAQALNLPFAQHELAHQHFQKELQQTIDELAVKVGTWSEYVMDYYPQLLRDWLIGHITNDGMQMKPVLESRPYDFEPV